MTVPGERIGSTSFARRKPTPFYAGEAMVAAAHPLAVEAGLAIFRQGGNAFDAAVAAGLACAVVMPEMCGLGGDLFAVFTAHGDAPRSMQASGRSARGASIDLMREVGGSHMPYTGPHAISVPGMVDAYHRLLNEHGRLKFAEVVQPALALARNGYRLQPQGAQAIADNASLLAQDAAAASIFLAHGNAPAPGTLLRQTDLANTLERIGDDGNDVFYRGEIAERMTAYLASIGGKLTLEDFADYASDLTTPYSVDYREFRVHHACLPSQGIILLEELNILRHADLSDPGSAASIHLMVEAKKRAFADRIAHLHDGAEDRIAHLLDQDFGRQRFASIDANHAAADVEAGDLHDGDTTYLCTSDMDGNMVSLVQSVSSAFGSGIVAGDTGVVMNNRAGRGFSLEDGHPNIYAPGKRTMHTLNCYLITDDNGTPIIVGGTPGGDAQPQWNLQAIVGLIDAGLDVQAAIEQPRWTSWPGTDPANVDNPFELRVEGRVPASVREELAAMGHAVKTLGDWSAGGAAQIIARNPANGLMTGGSDTRVEGCALGY